MTGTVCPACAQLPSPIHGAFRHIVTVWAEVETLKNGSFLRNGWWARQGLNL